VGDRRNVARTTRGVNAARERDYAALFTVLDDELDSSQDGDSFHSWMRNSPTDNGGNF
jgi:hypothetical protein